jgi:hypothetical protein
VAINLSQSNGNLDFVITLYFMFIYVIAIAPSSKQMNLRKKNPYIAKDTSDIATANDPYTMN